MATMYSQPIKWFAFKPFSMATMYSQPIKWFKCKPFSKKKRKMILIRAKRMFPKDFYGRVKSKIYGKDSNGNIQFLCRNYPITQRKSRVVR